MKKIFAVFILLAFVGICDTLAQKHNHNWCGTSYADEEIGLERLVRNRANLANLTLKRMPIMWTPLKIHIVNKTDGTGGVSPIRVYEMLCVLNEEYLDQDIQFFVLGDFNYINSSNAYTNPGGASGTLLSNRVSNGINVFLTKEIGNGSNTLGYYDPSRDWLVVREDQVSAEEAATIVHEVGHFFTLAHPFRGWGQSGYDMAMYGNPAPDEDSNGNPTELVNGSNCTEAGDKICDTPANYGVGFGWSGCDYTGGLMDPNGVLLDPDETNHMDYFIGCSTDFSDEQKMAIAADLASRPNLHTSEDFDMTPLTDVEMVSPIDSENLPGFATVTFDWTAVPGATSYVIEIDRFVSFIFEPSIFTTSDNFIEVSGIFDPNKNYYWRVKAIKDGYFCSATADDSSTGKFRTGDGSVAVNEISEVASYTIAPNPLSTNQVLNINLESTGNFDANINLYSLSGQKIITDNRTFGLGNTNYEMSVEGLAEGMYILSIETESGVLNEKIVVTK